MSPYSFKLDNPVWHALSETHKDFSTDYNNLKCYDPDYCPFGGSVNSNTISEAVDTYAAINNNFFIVGDKPVFSERVSLKNELICLQMVIETGIQLEMKDDIMPLNNHYEEVLFELVNLVQPGYFKKKTISLGNYYGIFKDEKLVAVTGERMKMYDLTEISAVVTHPGYTGKGYAKQLVAYTVNKIFEEGKNPFLHVAETNTGAIKLYEQLGFKTRRKISFWNFVTNSLA